MLSKNKIKFVQSLHRKKIRDEKGLFIAEGDKLIQQLIGANFAFHSIFTSNLNHSYEKFSGEIILTNYDEIKKISTLKTPQDVIAVCYQPKSNEAQLPLNNSLVLALDNIQDPGNLGTIIRLASWFGITQLICSNNTADCYNPKVIQASMGAIAHLSIHYVNLPEYLAKAKENGVHVYGTFLDGNNIYTEKLKTSGIIVMGNEGNGITPEVETFVDFKLLIPAFSKNGHQVESLNVSMATAIICSEFRRSKLYS